MKPEEILSALPDGALDQIAGGLSEWQENLLRTAMAKMKNEGYSMEDALKALEDDKLPDISKEIADYVTQNWDQI